MLKKAAVVNTNGFRFLSQNFNLHLEIVSQRADQFCVLFVIYKTVLLNVTFTQKLTFVNEGQLLCKHKSLYYIIIIFIY